MKWRRDFSDRNVRKDQVEQLGPTGEPSGKFVWRIYVVKTHEAREINYKERDEGWVSVVSVESGVWSQ